MPRNGFVMGVTNAILNIMKTENNCGVKDAKQMPATKKKGSTPPATLRKKGRKYQSSNANALEDLVSKIYQEVSAKLMAEKATQVVQPVQREFHGDPNSVSTESFDQSYTLPETKRAAREALLFKNKAEERALNAYLKTKVNRAK